MSDIKLPEPVGFRSRYRSEPGMVGHYPWTYADHRRRKYDRPECEYEDLFTADQLRAAVEADRAARVPMTPEQVCAELARLELECKVSATSLLAGIRLAEAIHGITSKEQP